MSGLGMLNYKTLQTTNLVTYQTSFKIFVSMGQKGRALSVGTLNQTQLAAEGPELYYLYVPSFILY